MYARDRRSEKKEGIGAAQVVVLFLLRQEVAAFSFEIARAGAYTTSFIGL